MNGEIVTLVNRTMETVHWMYDGREYKIGPLESKPVQSDVAAHGRNKTRYGFDETGWKYRLGIKEYQHNCDPIEPESRDAPEQFVDLLHRKDDLRDRDGEPLIVKQFSNDLGTDRNISF